MIFVSVLDTLRATVKGGDMLTTLDGLVIGSYILLIMAVGSWFGRRQADTRDYFLGGRSVPWWAAGLSVIATETSALTFIGVPAVAYASDWQYIQLVTGSVLARFLLAFVLINVFYRADVFTPYGYLLKRFGPGTKNAAAVVFIFGRIFASSFRLLGFAIAIKVVLSVPLSTAILITGIAAIIYTFLGGIRAVIWTDVVQGATFMLGGGLSIYFLLRGIPGGWEGFLSVAREHGKLTALDLGFRWDDPYNIVSGLVGGLFLTMATHGTDHDMVQRMLTCRNSGEGQRSIVLSGILVLPVVVTFLLVGSLLFAYYKLVQVPYELPSQYKYIFPTFILHGLPAGLSGFVVAGLVAAAMSSLDSALSALASTSVVDLYRPYIRRDAPESHYLKVSRILTVLWGAVLVGVAMSVGATEDILAAGLGVMTLFYGSLLGVFLLARFTRRGNTITNGIGMALSVLLLTFLNHKTAILEALGTTRGWLYELDIAWPWFTVIGTALTFCVGALGRRKQVPFRVEFRPVQEGPALR